MASHSFASDIGQAALIGIDWGSTNARAFLYDQAGRVLEQRHAPIGVSRYPGESGVAAMTDWLGAWLSAHPALPMLLCGMAGSKSGWRETGYVPTPAAVERLVDGLLQFEALGRRVAIVPGVAHERPGDGFRDVMRGEETQIVGLPAACMQAARLDLVMTPGTHNKWIHLQAGRMTALATYMTGEMFALLRQHSLLGPVIVDGPWDEACFLAGVDTALTHPDWLHQLFGVRARGVQGLMPAADLGQWLSGLLIGYEIQAALNALGSARPSLCGLIASAALCQRYASALAHVGIDSLPIDGDQAAASGLWQLATRAGLC
ncbi:2-dehydro-3-deoxygalactonokinase [Leeia oryzae]|uniref:2-dehydro-3-deoxygalactonokinase n=1 Tax=Leeia oryzae TaxID=356662 RepID=UPI000685709D|nr:2-dehydro-3-deoxygalactonokinase [Leeia oryzae]